MKRRDFLKVSTMTATAVSLGLVACSREEKFVLKNIPESEKLKIGIVGLGSRGGGILKVLQNVPEFRVEAICDIFDFRIKNAKKKIDNEVRIYKDFNKLLDDKNLDAVIIAVPLFEHFRVAMAALDRDIHIMCEKALAYSIDECKQIKLKADKSSKVFQISYQYQLNPMFQTIKEIIDKGYCGKITRIEGVWDRNNDWRRELPSPSLVPEVPASELDRIINWRMYKEFSGGLNAELGSHQFNMIDNILGTHPTRVMGSGGIDYWKDGRDTLDNVHLLFDYPDGVKVSFHSGTTNKYEGYQLKIYGKKGTIISRNMDTAFIYPEEDELDKDWKDDIDSVTGASIKIIDSDKKRNIKPKIADDLVYPSDNFSFNATWLLYKNFAAAIKGEEKLKLGLNEGYRSAISVHMANQAVRNSEIVEWKKEYDI
jgi:predicted dehydrogenase